MIVSSSAPRIIVALDQSHQEDVLRFVNRVSPQLCGLKVGKALFTRQGPAIVRDLVQKGFFVFLDLKFHDIPNTVAEACAEAAALGVAMLNVHASGGIAMMQAARNAIDQFPREKRPLLIGVTLLTSLNAQDLQSLGIYESVDTTVLQLATQAKKAALDGVVCSAQEAGLLRSSLGEDFVLVTPGIRFSNASQDDQKRTMTAKEAIAAGADYLVIGRSIIHAQDPVAVLKAITRRE